MDKLLIAVLGKENSGKTKTWQTLFEQDVRTGKRLRKFYFNDKEYVEVFLVSGSPEEREKYVDELITVNNPNIVLCSVQYAVEALGTFNYFIERQYSLFVQWLNPGHSERQIYFDYLGMSDWLLAKGATLSVRNGNGDPTPRAYEINDYLYGWAKSRDLIKTK